MTTFQDQPPQSRRAVRQSERDGATGAQAASGEVPVTPPQPSFVQQPAAPPVSAQGSQPESQQPQSQQAQSHAAPPASGRRSRVASPSGLVDMPTTPPYPGSEPLTYATQGAPGAQQPPQTSTPVQHTGEQPAFRVRDFSPAASRRAPSPAQNVPVPDAAPLDYRTQAGPAVTAVPATPVEPAAPVASASSNPPVSLTPTGTPITASGTPLIETALSATGTPLVASAVNATGTPEVAMTRRELRAQQAERDAAAARASGTFAVPPLVEPAPPASSLSTAMAEFEALTRAAQRVAAPLPAVDPEQAAPEEAAHDAEPTSESDDSVGDSALEVADEQQRARDAAAAAHAAAQAEAASRARDEAKQQSELTAQRAFEAEQATRARLAQAAQAAQEQEDRAQAEAAQAEAAQVEDAPSAAAEASPAPADAPAAPSPASPFGAVPTPADPLAAILGSGTPPVSAAASAFPAPDFPAPDLPAPDFSAPAFPPPAPAAPEAVASEPAAPVLDPLSPAFIAPDLHQTGSHATSTGHWSRQAEIEDESEPNANPLSRDVGGGNVATTTSALVLPAIPAPVDFGTIINGTGEILVTGSIELPRSLGATGGDQRRYDDPDVDNLFDAFDNEIISTDSAPVRAIRAVSTHTSTHGVISSAKPKNGNRMLVILLGSTVALAAAVVVLLAVAANLL